jgi:hypothetical protein
MGVVAGSLVRKTERHWPAGGPGRGRRVDEFARIFGGDAAFWTGIAGAVVSVLGAVFSYRNAARQHQLNLEQFRFENDSAVIAWAGRVLSLMAEAYEVAASDVDRKSDWFKKRRMALLYGLSARADEGRLFFTNIGRKEGDEAKEAAFRGYRPPVLDCVVWSYEAVAAMPEQDVVVRLSDLRRRFVSEVQSLVDPTRREWLFDSAPR